MTETKTELTPEERQQMEAMTFALISSYPQATEFLDLETRSKIATDLVNIVWNGIRSIVQALDKAALQFMPKDGETLPEDQVMTSLAGCMLIPLVGLRLAAIGIEAENRSFKSMAISGIAEAAMRDVKSPQPTVH